MQSALGSQGFFFLKGNRFLASQSQKKQDHFRYHVGKFEQASQIMWINIDFVNRPLELLGALVHAYLWLSKRINIEKATPHIPGTLDRKK